MFQADGCVRLYKNGGDITLTTVSETLAHDVQILLLSMGIYSCVNLGSDNRENRKQSYYVRISYLSERLKFENKIGFISNDKIEKLIKLNSINVGKNKNIFSEETVESIDYIGEEDVFDIQTESEKFCANGVVVHNCFILSIDDDLVNEGGIMDLWVREARIFKYGSGVGTNYSNIRAEGEKLGGGGTSSGLMSFLKIGDRAAGAIKSGGTTRRAAKMVCLDLDHPEVIKFIDWKVEEEKKVAALIAAGYPSDYEGEAYKTVSGQNSNNSLRIPNSFFEKLVAGENWEMTGRRDGKVMNTISSKELWDKIAYSAWRCADPGTQYDTTINEWHTCPEGGRIRASNPCVTGDTFVATENGQERIKNLVDKCLNVVNGVGGLSLVNKVFKTGNKEVFLIKTKHGFTIKATADHLISTLKGDVKVKDLKTGIDKVILGKTRFGNKKISNQLAELIGAAVGDGCIYEDEQRTMSINMGKSEYDVIKSLNDNLCVLKSDIETEDGRKSRSNAIIDAGTTLRITTSVKEVISDLDGYAVLDKGSENKKFKDSVFLLDKQSQKSILAGLFSADGSVANQEGKGYYVHLDSTSLELLQQVQLMLLSFGIKGKIYEDRRGDNLTGLLPDGKGGKKECELQQSHSLYISCNSRFLFEQEIGFINGSIKNIQLRSMNEQYSSYSESLNDTIKSITFLGNEDVFDLTENDTNHFVANGIIIHNCSEYMFLDNTACNLASLNLRRFFDEETSQFDVQGFEYMVRLWTVVLEISVLMAQFPSPEVAQLSYDYRTLGLGFANLGSMLMVNGIAYDSEEGRAIGAAISAIMTGTSYKTSAEMASALGSFSKFEDNKENMMRVMRNHRNAAYNDPKSFEGLEIKPPCINPKYCPEYLLNAAQDAWDEAVELGNKYGYRNAQTTVIAPTGTIGLVMDCDTTGVEPDFALVKFKKLSGGGYFKIINQSIPAALKKLGYTASQSDDIVKYAKGHGTFDGAPHINHKTLIEKGFTTEDIKKLDTAVESAFDIAFVFNRFGLGDECMQRLGFKSEQYESHEFSLLHELGFTQDEIDAANKYACGTMTVEGAPHLKNKHLSVFDCANKCGKEGERFIHAKGHIKMMSAVQPFISGAISKTINLPNEATIDEIKECYFLSWQLGVKACALYRDGSKLSQPLSNKSDKKDSKEHNKEEVKPVDVASLGIDELLEELQKRMKTSKDTKLRTELSRIIETKKMPAKRGGFSVKGKINGQPVFLRTAQYSDGTLGEISINMSKEGATMKSLLNSFAIATSLGLQ
ncbi:MAG: hypothetical protein HQK96_17900, partial [Nitrospirae bacterium]|nr:hypothetical protein [Nitrospirota bacterium]